MLLDSTQLLAASLGLSLFSVAPPEGQKKCVSHIFFLPFVLFHFIYLFNLTSV